jgi:hypothetical protein
MSDGLIRLPGTPTVTMCLGTESPGTSNTVQPMNALKCGGAPVASNALWRSEIRNPIRISVV